MTEPLLSTEAAARHLGVSPRTLERWRITGDGPPYRKLARMVRYAPDDLAEWLTAGRRRSTSDPGAQVDATR